jgi:hypothetical protein
MAAAVAALCARDVVAEALWLAAQWHADPRYGDTARSAMYERLHDLAVTAPDDETAMNLIRAAVASGTAELGDLTAGSLDGLALAGITAGGDAGTKNAEGGAE